MAGVCCQSHFLLLVLIAQFSNNVCVIILSRLEVPGRLKLAIQQVLDQTTPHQEPFSTFGYEDYYAAVRPSISSEGEAATQSWSDATAAYDQAQTAAADFTRVVIPTRSVIQQPAQPQSGIATTKVDTPPIHRLTRKAMVPITRPTATVARPPVTMKVGRQRLPC